MSWDLTQTKNQNKKSSFIGFSHFSLKFFKTNALERKSLNSSLLKQVHFNQDEDDDYDLLINEILRKDNPKFIDLDKLQCFLKLSGIQFFFFI